MVTDEFEIKYEHELLNNALKIQAIKYLEKELLKSMKMDIEEVASKAVAQWADIKFSKEPSVYGEMNINVAFINNIIKTQNIPNPIQIIVN